MGIFLDIIIACFFATYFWTCLKVYELERVVRKLEDKIIALEKTKIAANPA